MNKSKIVFSEKITFFKEFYTNIYIFKYDKLPTMSKGNIFIRNNSKHHGKNIKVELLQCTLDVF